MKLSPPGWHHTFLYFRGIPIAKAVILLMEETLHHLIGSLSHHLQGFRHPRWCRISSINSSQLKRIPITYKTSNEANHFIWTICFRMLRPTHSQHRDYDIHNHHVAEPRWDYGLALIDKNLLRKTAVRRWNLGDLRNHTTWWVLLNLVVKASQLYIHFLKKTTSHMCHAECWTLPNKTPRQSS